jgi:O-antigen/teichoic acid export membrane protein
MLATVLRRAGWLGIGTAGGQALILLVTPILARQYSPHAFGLLALLMTICNISIAIGCWRYDLALPSSDNEDVAGLVRVCLGVAVVGALAAAAFGAALDAAGIASGAIGEVLAQPFLLGSCVGLAALFQAYSAFLLRRGRIISMAALRVSQGALFALLALGTPIGLLWAYTLAYAGGSGLLLALRSDGTRARRAADVMHRYRIFAQQGLPGAMLDVVGYSLCTWTVLGVYGVVDSGKLSQIQRLVGAPLMLASMSLAQILLRHTVELKEDAEQLRRLIGQLLMLMASAAFICLVSLYLFGERLLTLFLGARWQLDRLSILAICGAVMVRACVSPMSSLLATFRRFDLALRWQALYLCSALILFSACSRLLGFEHFLLFYLVHEAVLYGIYLRIIYSIIRR